MNLVCKKNYIQYETSTKKTGFTLNKAYNVIKNTGDIAIIVNDYEKPCRFFIQANTTLLYLYNYFHDEQTSRDIIIKNII